mmetsp:Transcript_33873/g.38533  ORF Transcript_33873/g.38533 Transcript_33873/m.38533 type:complete len:192 (-) Transcript_33873:64-639(-)
MMNMKRKRSVQFSEEKDQIRTIERLTNQEDIWCTQKETCANQQEMYSSVMQIRMEINNYSTDLVSVYSDCVTGRSTNPEVIEGLARWSDRRGLEFQTIRPIHQERQQRRFRLRQAVIEFQRRLKQEGIQLLEDNNANGMLAKVAKSLAAPAETFARIMGQADAISAKYNNTMKEIGGDYLRPTKRMRVSAQ